MKHLDSRTFSYKGQKSMHQSDINNDIFQDVDHFMQGNSANLYFDAPLRSVGVHPIFSLNDDNHFDDIKPFSLHPS